jgi:type II secretory pathway component PulK
MRLNAPNRRRDGYVIFAVLIVVVVLSLVSYRFAESMTGEYRAGVRTADAAQAKMAAVSGLHYAAAVLADRNTYYGELGGNPFDNADVFERVEMAAAPGGVHPPRTLYFDIRSVAVTGAGTYEQRFGVTDEGGKLNINSLIAFDPTGQVLHDALMKLPNMTEDIADAIVDWVDGDDTDRAAGAESSYYLSLSNGYKAKNGPLNSLDELLLVRGVTPALLYGGDTNRNGVQDDGESSADRGWSDFLTVYGREINVDMTGTARIYLNGDDLDTLYKQLQAAVGDEMAAYVVASKVFSPTKISANTSNTNAGSGSGNGQSQRMTVTASSDQLYTAVQAQVALTASSGKRIRSVMDLMDTKITLPRLPDAKPDDPDVVATSPLADPAKRNEILPKLLDKVTTRQAIELVPRVNVNTAPREVLLALLTQTPTQTQTQTQTNQSAPPLTEADVDAIIAARESLPPADVGTVSAAWLLTTDTLTAAQFKQVERYLNGSSMVFRVQSVGYSADGKTTARMEAVIDTNQGAPRFLHIRDLSDLENPRGFAPSGTTSP